MPRLTNDPSDSLQSFNNNPLYALPRYDRDMYRSLWYSNTAAWIELTYVHRREGRQYVGYECRIINANRKTAEGFLHSVECVVFNSEDVANFVHTFGLTAIIIRGSHDEKSAGVLTFAEVALWQATGVPVYAEDEAVDQQMNRPTSVWNALN